MAGSKRVKLIHPTTKRIKLIGVFEGQTVEELTPAGYVKFADYVFDVLKPTILSWEKYGRGENAYNMAILENGKTEFSETYKQFRSVMYH